MANMQDDHSEVEELLFAESPPWLQSSTTTPWLSGDEAGPSKLPRRLSIPSSSPDLLLDFSPEAIISRLEEERSLGDKEYTLRITLILRSALTHAIEQADTELLICLLSLTEEWSFALDETAVEMEDEEGWGILGMSIASSCGIPEKEEIVRAVVARWGIDIGPRNGRDFTGWTPLHLASLISTPPLISFLLTRGASPESITDYGLTPLDLISGMESRKEACTLLEQATFTGTSAPKLSYPEETVSEKRRSILQRRRRRIVEDERKREEQDKTDLIDKEKQEWIKGVVKVIDVNWELLFPPRKRRRSERPNMDFEEDETEDVDDGEFDIRPPNTIDHTSLAWGPAQLPFILDTFISNYRPVCKPLSRKSLPANAVYLYTRFAFYHCDESWMDDLLIAVLDRIEEAVYKNVDELAFLAFWAYNTTLLLYLIKCDTPLAEVASKLVVQLEELINAIHVFIIRIGERKVDVVLGDALLESETLEDFDNVRFEGEWTLFRSFGTKKQRSSAIPKASSIFANESPAYPASPNPNESRKGKMDPPPSSFTMPVKKPSMQQLRNAALDSAHNTVFGNTASQSSPKEVTDILSAVLLVLQLYEVNPIITIQAFSQIFFWISCELFNRILSRKKYLCRTKAVQIRMNITVFEDWTRINGLPIRTMTRHFEPVAQLLQWLQCQSAITKFDDLISTLQSMRSINPLQMRRAVRDYRFEVNEGRMSDECAQYLAQLQKDWEKRGVQTSRDSVKADLKRRSVHDDDLDDPAVYGYRISETPTPIDSLFDSTVSLADFMPRAAPEPTAEMLDSRFMLPFELPRDNTLLIATPAPEAAFSAAFPSGSDGSRSSRPPSRSGFTNSKPLAWTLPQSRDIRALPLDFFEWLKNREVERRHRKEMVKPRTELQRALQNPLGQSQKTNLPSESDDLPIKSPEELSTPIPNSFPLSGLPTSTSIDHLREQVQISFSPSPPINPRSRSNTFELVARSPPLPVSTSLKTFASPSSNTERPSMPTSTSTESVGKRKWWRLGRKQSQAEFNNENELQSVSEFRGRKEDSNTALDVGTSDLKSSNSTPGKRSTWY